MTFAGGGEQRSPLARFGSWPRLLLAIAGLVALGVWQLDRRVWKLGLIARVDAAGPCRAHRSPRPGRLARGLRRTDEYLRVRVAGHFLNGQETLSRLLTALGPGFWVLTPLKTDQGFIILVNRGFVPPERRSPAAHNAINGETTVTGLLRMRSRKAAFCARTIRRRTAGIPATSPPSPQPAV